MSRKFWIALLAAALVLGGIVLLSLLSSDSVGGGIDDDTSVDTPPVRDYGQGDDGFDQDDPASFDQDAND